tara:strand:+ start:460 stop:702 length:243 start_codon:yes stop_codon:yes gene_type:complete
MELILDEETLNEYIAEVASGGPSPHKGIYNLLLSVQMLGYIHRDYHNIKLYFKEHDAETSEDYAEYLDKKASGLDAEFNA